VRGFLVAEAELAEAMREHAWHARARMAKPYRNSKASRVRISNSIEKEYDKFNKT
jgi:hypothetical protein